jgi:hypothetical protein
VRDRVGRTGHERAHLVAILSRRRERAVQCIVEPGRVELARGDGLQASACCQGDHVARAKFQPAHEVGFGDRIAHHERRHTRGETLTLCHGIFQFLRVRDAEEQQLWCVRRRERVGEIREVSHPRAMHGLARVAQGAVDGFDGVLLPRQDDHRNRTGFGQNPTP